MPSCVTHKNKILILVATIFILIDSPLSAQQVIWERNAREGALQTTPSWMEESNERGFAYGEIDGVPVLVIASRTGGPNLRVVNALTGEDVTSVVFDMTGVEGGLFAVQDVGFSADGKVVVNNLTVDASLEEYPFKIYVFEPTGGAFIASYAHSTTGTVRLGDKATVIGSWTDGTLAVYAAQPGASTVHRFSTDDQGDSWIADTITLTAFDIDNATIPSNSSVARTANGDFLINGNGSNVRRYNSNGEYLAGQSIGFFTSMTGVRAFTAGESEFVVLYAFRETSAANPRLGYLQVYNVDDPWSPVLIGESPKMSTTDNASAVSGDVTYRVNDDESWIVYGLSTGQGLMAYGTLPDYDVVNVTFTLNTSTIPDTVRADGFRFTINGSIFGTAPGQAFIGGETIDWGATATAELTNIGGDYWQGTFQMNAGDTLLYKYRWNIPGTDLTQDELGISPDVNPAGWDTRGIVVAGDTVLPIEYFNTRSGSPNPAELAPFETKPDSIALFFRVNVGAQAAINTFDPETMSVGVRGSWPLDWASSVLILQPESMPEGSRNAMYSGTLHVPADSVGVPIAFKYVYGNTDEINSGSITWDDGADAFNADNDGNNRVVIGQTDTTFAFKFFQGRRPPSADIVTTSVQFAVNVSALEELDFFNRAIGDKVSVPGEFNSWDTMSDMTYNDALDAWTTVISITEEVGARLPYKYFINWDESRRDPSSPNYIPALPSAWEEPGITGGGDRILTLTGESNQSVDDYGRGVQFFNSIPIQGIIRETIDGEDILPIRFVVDMDAALTHNSPFNPELDSLFLVIETPFFGLTQGIPVGYDWPILDEENRELRASTLMFTKTDDPGNIYELEFEVQLPTENHIGFLLAYTDGNGGFVINGEGFNAGRRYYRYILPLDDYDPTNVIWPSTFELAPIEWKAVDLDFETPPFAVGAGTNPVVQRVNVWPGDTNQDGIVDSRDIFSIGLEYGQSLSESRAPTTTWSPQLRPVWDEDTTDNRRLFADANGDGVVNAEDVLVISLNYGKTTDSPDPVSKIVQSTGMTEPVHATLHFDESLGGVTLFLNDSLDVYGFFARIMVNGMTDSRPKVQHKTTVLGENVLFLDNWCEDDNILEFAVGKTDHKDVNSIGFMFSIELPSDELETPNTDLLSFDFKEFRVIKSDGSVTPVKVTGDLITSVSDSELPITFNLYQNFPNPFNPSTTIRYSIPDDGQVVLRVFDILGRQVATLENSLRPAGTHEVQFDSGRLNLASGVYLYTIQVRGTDGNLRQIKTRTMMLIK